MDTRRLLAGWPKALLLMLAIVVICCPNLVWGQAEQRVPIELKVKLDDSKTQIGHVFVEGLKNR